MSYQVLARKWRPRDFISMIGQDHVTRVLTYSLNQKKLHHAYLFTGTRGVGKTTLARIFAKALNCKIDITSKPCNTCYACCSVDNGCFIDYIEVDAASHRGVDEITKLLEKTLYTPVNARFKIFMIDEVHMLTNHAFNAMLKILEEPPSHLQFILATTNPQKIPATIVSRCLQLNFKYVSVNTIVQYLAKMLKTEKIIYEISALRIIANAANGSIRDALSLTDQAIAYDNGSISEIATRSMLGITNPSYLIDLLNKLSLGDSLGLLNLAEEIVKHNLSFYIVLQELAVWLHNIAWVQFIPATELLNVITNISEIEYFASIWSPEQVQLLYQIVTVGRNDLRMAPDEYTGFTMVLLRMLIFVPDNVNTKEKRYVSNSKNLIDNPGSKFIPTQNILRNKSNLDLKQKKFILISSKDSLYCFVKKSQSQIISKNKVSNIVVNKLLMIGYKPYSIEHKNFNSNTLTKFFYNRRNAFALYKNFFNIFRQKNYSSIFTVSKYYMLSNKYLRAMYSYTRIPVHFKMFNNFINIKRENWPVLAIALPLRGIAKQLALQSEFVECNNKHIILQISIPILGIHSNVYKLATAISSYLGQKYIVEIKIGLVKNTRLLLENKKNKFDNLNLKKIIFNDKNIQILLNDFGGKIIKIL